MLMKTDSKLAMQTSEIQKLAGLINSSVFCDFKQFAKKKYNWVSGNVALVMSLFVSSGAIVDTID
jgi:hypothetical protein